MEAAAIDEMTGSELLDHVGELAHVRMRCEAEILRAAVQHASLNAPEALDPGAAHHPGRERAVHVGGAATPEVTEFAAAELGARLGVSSWSARALMADGLDLVHRLPLLWQRVERLETPAHLARLVARRTRDLGPEQAAYVDSRVAPYADGRLTWTRFQTLVDASVKAADPERAAAAERRAAEQQVAMPTHSDEHGMRGLYIRAPFATVAVFDAALERVAQILADLGDTECRDRRRVKALLILSRPDLAARLVAGYRAVRPPRRSGVAERRERGRGAGAHRREARHRLGDAAAQRRHSRTPLRRDGLRRHRPCGGLRLGDRDLGPRPTPGAGALLDPSGARHPRPRARRLLRDPGAT
jgi:hypothetical protein